MGIRDWPAAERPREKLLSRGAKALSDAELLAIFLRTGVSGCDAVELARRLLGEFGSLRGLFGADQRSFCQAHGLGAVSYTHLDVYKRQGRARCGVFRQREFMADTRVEDLQFNLFHAGTS